MSEERGFNEHLVRVLKIIGVFVLLYLFLVSIKMMGSSFKMFGKGFAEGLITSTSHPVVGLFIGILATSLVQSSSTVTSLVVGFVGGGALPLAYGIPIIMGANIGTSITNTLVSLTFVTRKEDFKRAFAGATVHDFFNLCAVTLLFPLELQFHIIEKMALWLTGIFQNTGGAKFTSPLKHIIDPVVHAIQDLLTEVIGLSNTPAAVILLIIAVVFLICSLVFLVKTMRSMIISKAEGVVDKFLFRNDFVSLLIGMALTVAVQSSSVTTSLIVPLIGAGIVSLRRCYPFTLGANLGTTCTALLASLATVSAAAGGEVNTIGVTAAFAHLSFNILGIAIFYPLRIIPITLAKKLAGVATESKIWAAAFIIGVFFILPLSLIALMR
ncbi:MAG: hypothetical protein GF401_01770 [Chitinivibrionales bacterium]|nr:hypothetical protein [Chitinivibrionales bacterium]